LCSRTTRPTVELLKDRAGRRLPPVMASNSTAAAICVAAASAWVGATANAAAAPIRLGATV
jgi:hypothetical protein